MDNKFYPEVYGESSEEFPLESGEIDPINKSEAYRHFMTLPNDYPHCPTCHRALVYDGNARKCPKCNYIEIVEPDHSFWRKLIFNLRATLLFRETE